MKALSIVLFSLTALGVIAMFACWFIATWTEGDFSRNIGMTGMLAMILNVFLGLGAAWAKEIAEENA